MDNIKKYLNSRGLTIVELLTALIILSIIFIAFLTIFNQSMNHSSKVEDKFTGVNIAEAVLYEATKYFETTSPPTVKTYTGSEVGLKDGNYYIINNKKYIPEITISQDPNEKFLDLYRIHVVIYNVDENGNKDKALSELFDYIE